MEYCLPNGLWLLCVVISCWMLPTYIYIHISLVTTMDIIMGPTFGSSRTSKEKWKKIKKFPPLKKHLLLRVPYIIELNFYFYFFLIVKLLIDITKSRSYLYGVTQHIMATWFHMLITWWGLMTNFILVCFLLIEGVFEKKKK